MSHPLLPKLKELRLGGMAESLEQRAELAAERQLTGLEFLALLLDDELDRRAQRRMAQREREAGFENPKYLSQFDFAAVPTLDRGTVLEMAACAFIGAHENWLIHGPTGVGKSHPGAGRHEGGGKLDRGDVPAGVQPARRDPRVAARTV